MQKSQHTGFMKVVDMFYSRVVGLIAGEALMVAYLAVVVFQQSRPTVPSVKPSLVQYGVQYSTADAANKANAFRNSLLGRYSTYDALQQFCDSTDPPFGPPVMADSLELRCSLIHLNDPSGPTGLVRQHYEFSIHAHYAGHGDMAFESWEDMYHASPLWNMRQIYLRKEGIAVAVGTGV